MDEVILEGRVRDELKKSKTKEFRRGGEIPAVVYGHGENKYVLVNSKAFKSAIHTHAGLNVIINLKVKGKADKVIVKDVQRFPLDDSIIHVDFQRISLKEKIDVMVPLHMSGEPVGVKEKGGVLEHLVREVEVRCLPTEIPDEFTVDVSALDLGEGMMLKQVNIPGNIELLMDPEAIVANVVAPTKEEAPPEPAEGETAEAEPEVIGKGKKEEEGEEGKEGKPAAGKPAEGKEKSPGKEKKD